MFLQMTLGCVLTMYIYVVHAIKARMTSAQLYVLRTVAQMSIKTAAFIDITTCSIAFISGH